MGRIMVGISSWAEPELVRSGFYPAEVKTPQARLGYYAARFPVAEIDSSYHFFPTQRNLALWLENTPDGFTFDVKAFSLFTRHPTPLASLPGTVREKYAGQIQAKGNLYQHHLPDAAIDELWTIFIRTIEVFRDAGKLGAVLFQFPPWFHPEPDNFDHIGSCRERLSSYQVAVEFRVGSWLDRHREETVRFLRKRGISLVCVDEPQGFKSSVPPVREVTAPLAIVRFHGRNSENWESKCIPATERYNYLYREEELTEWVPGIRTMSENSKELHIIFKNKHADFPVKNALRMKELLGLT
ncbi:MAG: DUF72 domain-containing protein [Dehalococcoidales bacterium]|nr:DUF72 domain-containing protein [Dehalococcoidales bacterium]